MDFKKYCIVCGNENFSRSKKFCCDKCRQQYYYQTNRDRLKEYKQKDYQKNKEEYLERRKKYYLDNSERSKEYSKNYYLKNKEQILFKLKEKYNKKGDNGNGKIN